MPPDYSGRNLRGRSFKGENLADANFSYADIRGANFTGAILTGANFTGAEAGLQNRWVLLLVSLSWLLSGISGLFLLLNGTFVGFIFNSSGGLGNPFLAWVVLTVTVILYAYIIVIRQGIGVGLSLAVAVTIAFSIAISIAFTGVRGFVMALALSGALVVAGVVVGAFAFAFAIAAGRALAFAFAGAFAFTFAVVGAIILAVAAAGIVSYEHTLIFPVATGGSAISAYVGWRAMKGDEKYTLVKNTAVIFASIGGTSFRSADLTDANFTEARLKSTDLRNAKLIRTCFHNTKLLDRIRPGNSYLKHSQIRQLILTGKGQDKNFDRFNLRGINLKGALLNDTSFNHTDLSRACLQDADLSRAKLVKTQLDYTDFTGATLTGVYIQNWNITHDTNFRGVKCEYVYMRLPTKENPNPLRKPDNNAEVFADGEFGDFIQPIFDTLDLYHSQAVDPRAIAISFKKLAENNPNAELEIVAIERRGEDKILIRAKTATTANKSELSKEYFINYNQLKSLAEKDFKALITEKESQISRLENMIKTAFERPSFYIETYNNQGDSIMPEGSKKESHFDLKGSQIAGGVVNADNVEAKQIGGNINNYTPQQKQTLADAATEIQELLEQLEKSYSTDTTTGKMALATEAITQIESNPGLTARILSALKVGGVKAFEQFLSHPAASFVIGALEDWEKTKEN